MISIPGKAVKQALFSDKALPFVWIAGVKHFRVPVISLGVVKIPAIM